MSESTIEANPARQLQPAEDVHAVELAFLAAYDDGPRPPGWKLTPKAVVAFVVGSAGQSLTRPKAAAGGAKLPARLVISEKFVGERALVERCVVTLAGERGLLLVGEPGTAKSMLSELLSAAVGEPAGWWCRAPPAPPRISCGTAGTTRRCWRTVRAGRPWCPRQ